MSNRIRSTVMLRCAALSLLLAVLAPPPADAQVGHPPGASPYRRIEARQILSLTGGRLSGGAGKASVGPTDGYLGGVDLDFRLGDVVTLGLGVAVADLERLLIDPTSLPENRVKGTARQQVVMPDVGLAIVMTGGKTWHSFAPYVGATIGMAFGTRVPEDSSQFQFRTHFHASPKAGFRFYASDRVSLRVEARDLLWRLSYPAVFFSPPPEDPDADPVLDPVTTRRNEWVHHLTVTIGLGYAIRM